MIPISPCDPCPIRRLRGIRRKNVVLVTNGERPDPCPGNICDLQHLFA